MNLEAEWHSLCINANLHGESLLAFLPEAFWPALRRVVDRFVEQPVPKSEAELAARKQQEAAVSCIVSAIVDCRSIAAAAELAELSLNQPDRLKFDLEVTWIQQKARR